MANNLSVVIGADISGLKKNIDDAKRLVDSYKNSVKSTGKLTDITEGQVEAYSKVVKELQKVVKGSMTTVQAEKSLTKQIRELKIQWANLSDTAKKGEFGVQLSKSLKQAEDHLATLKTQMKQADATMKDFSNTERNIASSAQVAIDKTKAFRDQLNDLGNSSIKIRDIEAEFQRIQSSSAPLKAKLKEIQSIMATMNLRGLNNTDVFQRMTAEAGRYKDALSDAANAARVMSSDTFKFDAIIGGLQGVTGAASAVTGAFTLFGSESEEVQKAMLKVQALMTIMQGLQAVSNAFNKDNAFMIWARSLGTAQQELAAVNTAVSASNNFMKASSGGIIANNTARGGQIALASGQSAQLKKTSEMLDKETIQLRSNSIQQEINTKCVLRDELALKAHEAALRSDTIAFDKYRNQQIELQFKIDDLINVRDQYNRLLVISGQLERQEAALAEAVASGNTKKADKIRYEIKYLQQERLDLERVAAANGDVVGSMKNLEKGTESAGKSIKALLGKVMSGVASFVSWGAIIGAVGYGLYELGKYIYHQTDAYKAQQEEVKRLAKEQEKAAAKQKKLNDELKTTGTAVGNAIASYKALQKEYLALQNSGKLNQWIYENKSAFEDLGLAVNNAAQAYAVFVTNSAAVIRALKAVAKAEAAQTIYKEQIQKYMEWQIKNGGKVRYRSYKAGEEFDDDKMKAAGLTNSDMRYDTSSFWGAPKRVLTESGAKKLNDYEYNKSLNELRQQTREWEAENERYGDLYTDLILEAEEAKKALGSLLYRPSITGSGGKPKKEKEITYLADSISDLEARIEKLKKAYKDEMMDGKPFKISREEYEKQLADLQKKLNDKLKLKGLLEIDAEGSLDYIGKLIKEKETELGKATTNELRASIQKEIDELNKTKTAIELYLKPVIQEKDLQKLKDSLEFKDKDEPVVYLKSQYSDAEISAYKAEDNSNALKKELDFNQQLLNTYKDQYVAIKARQLLEAQLSTEETQFLTIYDGIISKVGELRAAYEQAAKAAKELGDAATLKSLKAEKLSTTIDLVGRFDSAISGTYNSWKSLIDQWENKNAFEQLITVFSTLVQTFNSVIGVIETFNTISKLAADIQMLTSSQTVAAKEAEATAVVAASGSIVSANMAEAGSATAAATANTVAAGAGVTKSAVSKFGLWGIPLAIAGVAAIVALIAGIRSKKFANGGIVQGMSKIGDFNLARVNDGEMIMNSQQQQHLWNILNGGSVNTVNTLSGGGKVTFEIQGQKLVGVLNNYEKKMRKI